MTQKALWLPVLRSHRAFLSQGFPDFDPPKQLLDEAIRRLEKLSALLA